jgi:hypothetical protein
MKTVAFILPIKIVLAVQMDKRSGYAGLIKIYGNIRKFTN